MDLAGLINRITIATAAIDYGRKGFAIRGKEQESVRELKKINRLLNKSLFFLFLVLLYLLIGCDIDEKNYSNNPNKTTKIYSGNYGYNIAYRVVDNKIYSGSYGYEVAYRIENNKIYSGSYGYDVAYRIDGNKIYSGSYGYDVAFRVDRNKIYSGSYGYNTLFRIER